MPPTDGPAQAPQPLVPPPCFNFSFCGARAALEKRGRAVCRACAAKLAGREYPLRAPSKLNLYRSVIEMVEALDMYEPRRASGLRGKISWSTGRHPRRDRPPRLV